MQMGKRKFKVAGGQFLGIGLMVFQITLVTFRAAGILAFPCELAWQPSPDPTVSGYAIYYSVSGSSVTNRIDTGSNSSVVLPNLQASASYSFYVVSYNSGGLESTPSNLILYAPPALLEIQVKFDSGGVPVIEFQAGTGVSCHVEYTPTLSPAQWHWLGSATADSAGNVSITDKLELNSNRFYRAAAP